METEIPLVPDVYILGVRERRNGATCVKHDCSIWPWERTDAYLWSSEMEGWVERELGRGLTRMLQRTLGWYSLSCYEIREACKAFIRIFRPFDTKTAFTTYGTNMQHMERTIHVVLFIESGNMSNIRNKSKDTIIHTGICCFGPAASSFYDFLVRLAELFMYDTGRKPLSMLLAEVVHQKIFSPQFRNSHHPCQLEWCTVKDANGKQPPLMNALVIGPSLLSSLRVAKS